MKHVLLALGLLLASPLAHAQKAKEADPVPVLPINTETQLIDYTGVVEVAGAGKNELYARGKVWFASTFKSAQNVIQADDKEAGVLIGKGWVPTAVKVAFSPMPQKLWFTVKLSFKEGKYRYSVTDLMYESYPSRPELSPSPTPAEKYTYQRKKDGTPTIMASTWISALDSAAKAEVASIEASMGKPAAGDW